ncbi:hypothetical protein R1flu_005296 [Riccia fluitans]|uniref:DUF6737 domain-containing protein n=1 Tax=Riccia fluitans TaxID=41844 RepID=A0ABD1YWR4_9MARC
MVTRAVVCSPDLIPRSAFGLVTSSSVPLENLKAVAARRNLCTLQKGVRGLRRRWSRPLGRGDAAGSVLIRVKGLDQGERRNGAVVRAEGENWGRESNRDEDGVIKDMEVYLDDLSLEYESVWDTKPAWCQPWTILTTGLAVVGGSWLSFQNIFVTGCVGFVIGAWWFIFLYAYPLAYTEMIAERRKSVKNGDVDTFGTRRVR